MKAEHHVALRDGVVEALERGLTSAAPRSTHRDAKGEKGGMQNEFWSTAGGGTVITCGGEIQRIVVGGRSTYFARTARSGCGASQMKGAKKPARAFVFRNPSGAVRFGRHH